MGDIEQISMDKHDARIVLYVYIYILFEAKEQRKGTRKYNYFVTTFSPETYIHVLTHKMDTYKLKKKIWWLSFNAEITVITHV